MFPHTSLLVTDYEAVTQDHFVTSEGKLFRMPLVHQGEQEIRAGTLSE